MGQRRDSKEAAIGKMSPEGNARRALQLRQRSKALNRANYDSAEGDARRLQRAKDLVKPKKPSMEEVGKALQKRRSPNKANPKSGERQMTFEDLPKKEGKRSTDQPGKPLTSRKTDLKNKQKQIKSKFGKLRKDIGKVRKNNEIRKAEFRGMEKKSAPPPPKGPDMGKPGIKNKYIKQMTGKKGIGRTVAGAAVLIPAAVEVFKQKFDRELTKNDARLAGQVNERERTRKAGIVHKKRNERKASRSKALSSFKTYINK